MKVLKFGGTSVGSTEAVKNLRLIVEREKENDEPLFVVCSAFSGITNSLLEATEEALHNHDYQSILEGIEQRHYEMIKEILPVSVQNPLLMLVKGNFNILEDLLSSVAHLGELSDRTKAKIVSLGEQLSCPIIAAYLNTSMPAEFKDARDLIHTNSNYLKAEVNFDITNQNIQQWAQNLENKVYVVTGFIATDKDKVTTTLGRGGSDYTAAILGAALNVQEVQIWTDVNGFMTADPRLVKNAYSLEYLSYQEAMELSYFGAKVIYPPSLVPVISKEIPIWIKNTFEPEHQGTMIHVEREAHDKALITGISSINNVALVNVVGTMIRLKGFSARLFGTLSRHDINIILITQASSEHSISFVVASEDVAKARLAIEEEFLSEITTEKLQHPEIDTNISIVAIVGERMKKTKGISGKLFSTLGKNSINIIAIAQGSSELNISTVISKDDLTKALNVIHDAFLLSPVKTYHVFCAGTGNIGQEFLGQICQEADNLIEKHKIEIKVLGIANTRKMLLANGSPVDIAGWKDQLEEKGLQADLKTFIQEVKKYELPNTVFIDNTSSKFVVEEYENLFRNNISVVTCNKISNSESYAQYLNLKHLAAKNGVSFLYETNVGAGLPIIKTLNDLVISGDEIIKIEAILSGTISYIFNNYVGERTFEEVVREAQELGYTEPDPRDDLNGLDFSRKMLILARENGLPLELSDVNISSFLPEACLNANSVEDFYKELKNSEPHFASYKEQAAKENKKLRLIGILENNEIKVEVMMVDSTHPFFNLSGSDNIISFTTARYQNTPLVVKGPGAGASVTAAGVFADLVRVTTL
ncbi:TPA: bifunctional aspartate kinase/homoserine dehydrogenase I [Elizabethkingia anophelis]|uniref:bifunctional aspartate kinase/homoserine dehydrogenase I n=1 Tax=Elizabethkingia anophelis TaxID=1117645 RepID=UPI0006674468|nr:bifunctional aspartate kinase/homoserine dehydrogenase I [Elizabethkingia anophelis]MCT3726814.1 bifunctional aspartate kinase/homoserine dehydrogenase I [Elizabethkingia anophelis]MCT3944872.1 bifunctional aspartate kinase/homoserine dehydrogenase I [Elizabethkingia anophelis]MCT3994651.1 bifunctional aspartate kinase/homoserine dehydrogenase I [Elizabethkingia anophelis]MCT3998141.1 bifunctional aspartate kinase/homoserine dehydrogenase I [Elizabethkingia anophelis]MCT4237043.1 bifunction